MASSLLLKGQFSEALPYLESIAEFCSGDDTYHWNLGLAKAAVGEAAAGCHSVCCPRGGTEPYLVRQGPLLGTKCLAWEAVYTSACCQC